MKDYSNYLTHKHNQEGLSHDDLHQSNLDQDSGSDKDHGHGLRADSSRVLFWSLLITFGFSIVEGVGGYLTHSITLQSDALHMLTDAAGILIAYLANHISKRPATVNLTFGYGNAEAIGSLINCIFTLILTLGLLFEVLHRFVKPVEVHGYGLFVVASIGLLVNCILAFKLSQHSHSLNVKAAFIHTLGDLLASLVAIIAGVVIYFTNLSIVDPILSLIVIGILIASNYKLIKKSLRVLMAGVPEGLDYIQVGRDIEAIKGIISVHDLHIWYMTANKAALSSHVIADDPSTWQESLLVCQRMLSEKHGIEHVTLQYEFKPDCQNIKCCN